MGFRAKAADAGISGGDVLDDGRPAEDAIGLFRVIPGQRLDIGVRDRLDQAKAEDRRRLALRDDVGVRGDPF